MCFHAKWYLEDNFSKVVLLRARQLKNKNLGNSTRKYILPAQVRDLKETTEEGTGKR